MYTLTILFNQDMTQVLMCKNLKMKMVNFIGGVIKPLEDFMDASYRELEEETGITRDDVKLNFLQTETHVLADNNVASLYITYGVLNKDIDVVTEKNPLIWVNDFSMMHKWGLDGDCAVYINRALRFHNAAK